MRLRSPAAPSIDFEADLPGGAIAIVFQPGAGAFLRS
jgi:hypothetical protein